MPTAASRPVVLALGCLLLVSGTSAAGEGHLQVLSEVVSGPARGRPLALHLDPALPADVRWAVVGVEAMRSTPHLTLTLDFSHSRRQAAPPGDLFSSSAVLHVVLWLTPRPELLQALWLHWKPRNLLLFSLGPSSGTDLLRHEALSGVENVALIGHLSAQADSRPDALGVYTVLPFSPGGVRLLGPWRREAFASWEALFPDRFLSFEGYTFHIASRFIREPFLYLNKINPKKAEGVSVEILKVLCSKLNFTCSTTADSIGSNWSGISKGTWNDVFGMIERQEKNFTINSLALNIHRAESFDFSTTLSVAGFGAFLMTPPPLPRWMGIARVFNGTTWMATLSALLAITCLRLLQVRRLLQPGPRHRLAGHTHGRYLLQVRRLLQPGPRHRLAGHTHGRYLLQVSSLLQPGPRHLLAGHTHGRYLLQVRHLLQAARVSPLTKGEPRTSTFTIPMSLLQERVGGKCTKDGAATSAPRGGASVWLDTQRPLVGQSVPRLPRALPARTLVVLWFFQCFIITVAYTSNLVGIFTRPAYPRRLHDLLDLVNSGYRSDIEATLTHRWGSGSYYEAGELLLPSNMVWFFPKHTPWKHKFDHVMQQLLSAGLVNYWIQDSTAKLIQDGTPGGGGKIEAQDSERDSAAWPLSLQHLQGVFYILGLAWAAGGAVLLGELLTHRHKHGARVNERPLNRKTFLPSQSTVEF
ncbi:uncharacterized protein LOC126991447 [Eriocheir sinensis]|uniref:uncharacterized protein LOC126991447 n=1 Tax=Eriocheir sinensis TaxID=95602 RepID=UPI0021C5C21C|nr:uncharacterized protein LOC126991447 [Eriocheir sinensis]